MTPGHLGLGQKEETFEWLERAYQAGEPGTNFLKVGPLFAPLRDDPRFTDLLLRMNLEP